MNPKGFSFKQVRWPLKWNVITDVCQLSVNRKIKQNRAALRGMNPWKVTACYKDNNCFSRYQFIYWQYKHTKRVLEETRVHNRTTRNIGK